MILEADPQPAKTVFSCTLITDAHWRDTEPLGASEEEDEIAKAFVMGVDLSERGGLMVHSPLELPIALEIQAYSIVPALQQHRADLAAVLSPDIDLATEDGMAAVGDALVRLMKVSPADMTEPLKQASRAFQCALTKVAFLVVGMVRIAIRIFVLWLLSYTCTAPL